jgi:asparagine synthase (glutamine-hydrolysing)
MLESSRHLYQAPLYKSINNLWTNSYSKVIEECDTLTIDNVSIASIISFGQTSQNRTLFKEIKRLPWLAQALEDGSYLLEKPPKHDFLFASTNTLANLLFQKLCAEAREVIKLYRKIYILTTGGLDSRIIVGIFRHLHKEGETFEKPICLTWGLENSRDVYYGKQVAKVSDLEWYHMSLDPQSVIKNIENCGHTLGLIHSPEMLHSMLSLSDLPKDSIVIAGSFGDSIGRGEFSNVHLLQLIQKTPTNTYNLIENRAFDIAKIGLDKDLQEIHMREGPNLQYVQCEYWMQGYRMRNGLCHALSVINSYSRVYQMFTAPEVYSFMWSLHPSIRGNETYFQLLKEYFPSLASIPWARTNKPLVGKTSVNGLKEHYHDYTIWSGADLNSYLDTLVDPEWFHSTGVFDANSIRKLSTLVRVSKIRVGRLNDIWLWLAGFRYYIDSLERKGKRVIFNNESQSEIKISSRKFFYINPFVLLASMSSIINRSGKALRTSNRNKSLVKAKKEMLETCPPRLLK